MNDDLLFALDESAELRALEVEKCRRSPWYWLCNWAWTMDSHDTKNPKKHFPALDYQQRFTDIWMQESVLLVPKSRQMMITWVVVALYLHDAQFKTGRLIFFQSKKEGDAADLVNRAWFIYENQPCWMRPAAQKSYCKIEFTGNSSSIRGIPQGGDQIRMHTASGIFMDEAGFMPEAEAAFTASKPSIDGGGKITMVSSANPGFFEMLVYDRMEMAI